MGRRRLVALAWILVRTAAAAAAARALPLFCGIGIACTVLFSPQGMDARDVTAVASESLLVRLLLWAAWLLAATPVASALFSAPAAAFLRSLPVPRWEIAAILGAMLLLLQAPWMLLWGRGAGAIAGLAAGLLALAVVALLVTRLERWWARVAAGVLVCAVALAPPAAVVIGAALPIGAVAVRAAWVRAPEARQPRPVWVTGPAPVALSLAHHCRLLRTERSMLLSGCFVSVLGGWMAGIGARNTDQREVGAYVAFSLAVIAIPLVIACSGILAPLSDSASALGWLLDATGTTAAVRVFAERATVAMWGMVFGMVAGAAAGGASGVPPWHGFTAMLLHGVWGGIARSHCGARAAEKCGGRCAGRRAGRYSSREHRACALCRRGCRGSACGGGVLLVCAFGENRAGRPGAIESGGGGDIDYRSNPRPETIRSAMDSGRRELSS